METFKEVNTITTIDENNEVVTKTTTKLHTIRTWSELSREEQEQEIESNSESIYMNYQDDLYNLYDEELERIKDEYKNIDFDYVYLDGNSQGAWIDSVKNFKVYYNIDVFGETLEVDDIDLHIRRYIEEITENNINIYDYYIDSEKLEKIQKSKKYKEWINTIIKEVNSWIDEVNEAAKEVLQKEYCYPYNLDDPEDKEWLDNYFDNEEFEKVGLQL